MSVHFVGEDLVIAPFGHLQNCPVRIPQVFFPASFSRSLRSRSGLFMFLFYSFWAHAAYGILSFVSLEGRLIREGLLWFVAWGGVLPVTSLECGLEKNNGEPIDGWADCGTFILSPFAADEENVTNVT
jgi:hypothetical protein